VIGRGGEERGGSICVTFSICQCVKFGQIPTDSGRSTLRMRQTWFSVTETCQERTPVLGCHLEEFLVIPMSLGRAGHPKSITVSGRSHEKSNNSVYETRMVLIFPSRDRLIDAAHVDESISFRNFGFYS
jgi:hypothetical protein